MIAKPPTLAALCVYTIRRISDLKSVVGKKGSFDEKKRWITGKQLHDDAKRLEHRLPIIFWPAEKTLELFGWALLDDIIITAEGTHYEFSNLKPFDKPIEKAELEKRNGDRLNENFIRPYAICRTPPFLLATQ
jgi:hypothetical protein